MLSIFIYGLILLIVIHIQTNSGVKRLLRATRAAEAGGLTVLACQSRSGESWKCFCSGLDMCLLNSFIVLIYSDRLCPDRRLYAADYRS